jgi:hypothetical protein
MSSRFVSGGSIDPASGEALVASSEQAQSLTTGGNTNPRNQADTTITGTNQEQWEAVQRELDEERRRREEKRAMAAAGEEKSLYDVLQANKGLVPFNAGVFYYQVGKEISVPAGHMCTGEMREICILPTR